MNDTKNQLPNKEDLENTASVAPSIDEVSKGRNAEDVISGLTSSEIDAMMEHNTEVEDQQSFSGKGTPTSISLGYDDDREDEKQDYSDTNNNDSNDGSQSASDQASTADEQGGVFSAKGGFIKRAKSKKMKRGGLASKK